MACRENVGVLDNNLNTSIARVFESLFKNGEWEQPCVSCIFLSCQLRNNLFILKQILFSFQSEENVIRKCLMPTQANNKFENLSIILQSLHVICTMSTLKPGYVISVTERFPSLEAEKV